MKIIRSALLVLLTSSLAGLGVPAGFGQAKAHKPSAKKKPNSGSQAAPTNGQHSSAASSKKSAVKPSGKSAARSSGKTSKKARKQPGQKAPTNDRITEIQTALARDGSFRGSPTGKWDDDTTAAMRKFQAGHGLNASGKLDARTLQRLGLGSQTAGMAAPTPPPGATSRLTSSTSNPSPSADSARRQ
jgi:peptidoglycan hydrolase-like protein with peptidoglycan-binding domain